jgi:hypothetical protein
MNSVDMWRAVDPSSTEIQAASAVFEGRDVIDILPRLVMVSRTVSEATRVAVLDPSAGTRL